MQQQLQLIELPHAEIKLIQHTQRPPQKLPQQQAAQLNLAALLPANLFAQLPLDQLRIGQVDLQLHNPATAENWALSGALALDKAQLQGRVKIKRQQTDLGWADIEIKADNNFHLRLLENNSPFLVSSGTLSVDKTLQLASTQVMTLQPLRRWLAQIAPELNAELPDALQHLSGSITSSGITQFPITTSLSPDALLTNIASKQVIQSQFNLVDFQHRPAQLNIDQITATIDGTLEYQQQQLQIDLSPNSQLKTQQIQHTALNAPLKHLLIQLPQGLNTRIDLTHLPHITASDIKVTPTHLTIAPTAIKLNDFNLEPSPITLHFKEIAADKSALTMQLQVDAIQGQFDNKPLPSFALNANIDLDGDSLLSQFQLQGTDNPLQIKGHSQGDLSGQQHLQWRLQPLRLSALMPLARQWAELPADLSLQQGTLFHHGALKLKDQQLSITAKQSIEQATLQWGEVRLEQLQWHSNASLSRNGIFRDKGKVKLAKVKTGVEITNTQASYTFEHNNGRNLMEISEGIAQLLEGDVQLANTRFDPLAPDIDTQIRLNQLDLGAILNLEQQEGLSGRGKLSGNVPLRFKDNALTVADGALASLKPGGHIAFLATPAVWASAASNTGLKIALEALENFHFETLDIKLDYLKDGTGQFNTRLKGHNPDWNDGHPVDFSINIEENIPKLLQTLQFTDKLTRSIEQRYR